MIVNSLKGTKELAQKLAQRSDFRIVGLQGELGSGKTTFVQFFAKALGIKDKILSPTFVIFKSFALKNKRFKKLYHFDCYRINQPKEILDLGFKEIIRDKKNVVLIEWSDRIKNLLPPEAVILEFRFIDKNKREINVRQKTSNN